MQAYREVGQAVIASAVTDLIQGRRRAEEAYQFLCGASDNNRAMLEFWCFVAGYTPEQVMSTARARSVGAWRVWWLAHGKHRLKQVQAHLERTRSGFVSVNANGNRVTVEDRDGGGLSCPGEISMASHEHLAVHK